ncbi:MAG: D-alanyl-D-alanine dipeptidase [Alphaproteobacteria bacterium CG11_big_fil_rev_8_21_14_0_20_44_7]|nr:MAG: D-alanyl-D-alanine dipeptidase [Alphaproteobacteria bacterium CG11_big_fil_rev_8_21_14_0_20_44_7]
MLHKITTEEFGVELEIAYASTANFTGKAVYKKPEAYLHPKAAQHLKTAISYAAALGYKIKIFDAYRPSEAQYKLWEHTPDANFLSHPDSGSPHSRGIAIDLTLIDENGVELDMGTGFDDFTKKSYHSNLEISAEAQKNRRILLGIMSAAGWDWYDNEWWHYQLFNPRAYRLYSDAEAGTGLI